MSRYSKQRDSAKFQVEGRRAVLECMLSDVDISTLFIQKDVEKGSQIRQIVASIEKKNLKVSWCSVRELDEISVTKKHQGVIAQIHRKDYARLEDYLITMNINESLKPLLVGLDRVQDPQNFGSIARSVEVTGASGVVVPYTRSVAITEGSMRASAGALNHIKVFREHNLVKTAILLKTCGFEVLAMADKSQTSLYKLDLVRPLFVLFGNEHDGLSKELIEEATFVAKIPQYGKVSSFNVSAALAIVLSEIRRQQSLI